MEREKLYNNYEMCYLLLLRSHLLGVRNLPQKQEFSKNQVFQCSKPVLPEIVSVRSFPENRLKAQDQASSCWKLAKDRTRRPKTFSFFWVVENGSSTSVLQDRHSVTRFLCSLYAQNESDPAALQYYYGSRASGHVSQALLQDGTSDRK